MSESKIDETMPSEDVATLLGRDMMALLQSRVEKLPTKFQGLDVILSALETLLVNLLLNAAEDKAEAVYSQFDEHIRQLLAHYRESQA